MSILNLSKTKTKSMFFGESLGIQQYLNFTHQYFDKNAKQQMSYFWQPQEVSLSKDIGEWKELPDEQKNIFTNTLKFQILLDSVQARGPTTAFAPYCSLPELESAINCWGFFEGIHSRSYTYIIKNLYSNPEEIFDSIYDNEYLLKRIRTSHVYYDQFISYPTKTNLVLAMINVFILEGLRFYTSFAIAFAFGENQVLEGTAKIISLIARDEALHLALTQKIINLWRKDQNETEFKAIIDENKDAIKSMFTSAVKEEHEWCDYLFDKRSIIGLNGLLCKEYINWIAENRAKKIGLNLKFNGFKKNPLPWMDNWLNSKQLQVAPQETSLETYVVGNIVMDDDSEFNTYSL